MIGNRQQALVLYSAHIFRQLLDSLARPGKITQLATLDGDRVSEQTNMYALGALLTLLDREVTFAIATGGCWLSQEDQMVQWLALRSSSRLAEPAAATFALFCNGQNTGLLTQLHAGTLLEPELSATALFCVEKLAEPQIEESSDQTTNLLLEVAGPGIEHTRRLFVRGLERAEVEDIMNARRYPSGIDVYLIDVDGRCVGLPRTTRIRIIESQQQQRGYTS